MTECPCQLEVKDNQPNVLLNATNVHFGHPTHGNVYHLYYLSKCHELKITDKKMAFVPFQIQAVENNAAGVARSSSDVLGRIFFQLL